MSNINLSEETSFTIYEWCPELASLIASRLYEHHPALRKVCVRDDPALLRLALEKVLAYLSTALQLEEPKSFADNIVSSPGALPAIVKLSLVDGGTVLRKISDTVKLYLPGPRGKLAAEYIRYALMRLGVPEQIAA